MPFESSKLEITSVEVSGSYLAFMKRYSLKSLLKIYLTQDS